MDAAGRDFHALGARALRAAIEDAEGFEAALLARAAELEAAGYHAQVLVKAGASLLFLVGGGRPAAGSAAWRGWSLEGGRGCGGGFVYNGRVAGDSGGDAGEAGSPKCSCCYWCSRMRALPPTAAGGPAEVAGF